MFISKNETNYIVTKAVSKNINIAFSILFEKYCLNTDMPSKLCELKQKLLAFIYKEIKTLCLLIIFVEDKSAHFSTTNSLC